jgi:hypothetical protein
MNADPDPDPAYHFYADPDLAYHFDADQDPTFHLDADAKVIRFSTIFFVSTYPCSLSFVIRRRLPTAAPSVAVITVE